MQEPDVKVGRIPIFNNWSPYIVADPDAISIGLEYFVNQGDTLWSLPDAQMFELAVDELIKIRVINREDVLDHVVIRMPKTYPAYFGTYDRFSEVGDYLAQVRNLYPLGRNGIHRYNNQDNSMLIAMTAVDGTISDTDVREALWSSNAEQEYHEARRPPDVHREAADDGDGVKRRSAAADSDRIV